MKRLFTICLSAAALISSTNLFSQTKSDTIKVVRPESTESKREEKNRNVMLNAENNNGPRQVNIGLPFTGDVVILENDVPVVYYYYPTLPTSAWRYDNSLSRMGLLSFSESALTFGKVGYTVQSNDRDASSSFKGFAGLYVNSFGSSRYDATVTGPLGKKGWGYTLSTFQNFDRGNGINLMYYPWMDRTQITKVGLQKKYNKGSIRLLYKYAESRQTLLAYSPLTYKGDGETSPLDNFTLGKDSYIVRSGLVPYFDANTGEAKYADLASDEFSKSESHNLYLTGNHRFDSGWKLTYSTMLQKMNTPFPVAFPVSLLISDPDQQTGRKFYYQGTNKEYTGSIQYVANQLIPQSDTKTWISRAEMAKKVNDHEIRFGLTHQYNQRKFTSHSGLYIQSVERNPQLLDMYAVVGSNQFKATNSIGLLPPPNGSYGSVTDDAVNKLAFYASDDFKVNKWLDLTLGARIEHQNIHDNKDIYLNDFKQNRPFVEKDFKNQWNKVGVANAVVKLSGTFGLLGDFTYNSWYDRYWDFPYRDANGNPIKDPNDASQTKPLQSVPKEFQTTVLNFGGGIFYNLGNKLSLVSKLTRITKNNIKVTQTVSNPANTNERMTFDPLFYDISTLGWSTDIVSMPFKNFTIHYLLTLQNPQYKNYEYGAFGVNYAYSDNSIPELSKTLMEIDPSYSLKDGKVRLWFSLRYFGKQYANATNAFYYNSRWENFSGVDYSFSRNINLKFQVTNFLDQSGVKGAIQGADQITDASPYVGRKVVAGSIRPRTLELTASFKF